MSTIIYDYFQVDEKLKHGQEQRGHLFGLFLLRQWKILIPN
jgi:hypothetical protein